MQQGKLTHAWVEAEASLPLGWQMLGLWREVQPQTDDTIELGDGWFAKALGPDLRVAIEALGESAPQALYNLAEKLRKLRGDPTGEPIASSETYKRKASAKAGIESVRKHASGADFEDLAIQSPLKISLKKKP